MQTANFEVEENGRLNVDLKQQTGDKKIKKHEDIFEEGADDKYDSFSVILLLASFALAVVSVITVTVKVKNRRKRKQKELDNFFN